MKVKCISNKERTDPSSLYEFLEVGKEYNVYGMVVSFGQVCYYICDRMHNEFPIAIPADLFEIVDRRLSRYWIFGFINAFENYPFWIFPEWLTERYFQNKLTDWEDREMGIFKSYRELMDLEFPDSSVTVSAQIGDDMWLICPECIDAWECSTSKDALVRCPMCKKLFNNPRYKNEYPHL